MVVLPPGARTRALAVCTRGIGGARCWWGWWFEVVVLCLRLPLLAVGLLVVVAALRKSKMAKCGLERRHWRRAMRSTCLM